MLDETTFDPHQEAANDAFAYATIYSMNSARRTKLDRSLERRASKSEITDRRLCARLNVDGDVQHDRRAENYAANVDAIRRVNANITSQQNEE